MSVCINPKNLLSYQTYLLDLVRQKVLPYDYPLSVTGIEDISGNINYVSRVEFKNLHSLESHSIIIKSVPPEGRLARYPKIIFPKNRLAFEYFYYQYSEKISEESPELSNWTPRLLHWEEKLAILLIKDLAPSKTLESFLLEGLILPKPVFFQYLGKKLGKFHQSSALLSSESVRHKNPSAQANHPYIFTMPFDSPEKIKSIWQTNNESTFRFDLQEMFLSVYGNELLPIARTMEAALYDDENKVLSHGDLHGDSIFVVDDTTVTVIDAELCDVGAAWFDVGTMSAHFLLLSAATGLKIPVEFFLEGYFSTFFSERVVQKSKQLNFVQQVYRMTGFEVIRRIIGAANASYFQEPLKCKNLLERAAIWILNPPTSVDFESMQGDF